MKKNRLIGIQFTTPKAVKDEFKDKDTIFITVEIKEHKKYGARAELYYTNSVFDRMWAGISKKERKKMGKGLRKALDSKKHVDTSKWVKPDEKSIRDELIKNLFMTEIFKEDWWAYGIVRGKAEVIYSILHSNNPSNPQTLTNFHIKPYFETILREMKSPIADEIMRISFPNYKKKGVSKKKWFSRVRGDESRKMYKQRKAKCLKNMIIKKPNLKTKRRTLH